MNQIYRCLQCSKQAFHQKMDRQLCELEREMLLLPIIEELRLEHPGVAARTLYRILNPANIGRDKFEALCFRHGFKLERSKAFRRTTDSSGVIRFPNLVETIEFTGINQAWSSDITYYQIADRFYYLTFIIDVYSRRIIGYSVSKLLTTESTTLPAIKMALGSRQPKAGLIFHSDGGGQYYSKEFLKLTCEAGIKNSMGEMAYENPFAERINGTIKNQYLKGYNPRTFAELVKQTKRALYNYNHIKPHKSLNNLPPVVYEGLLPAGGCSLTDENFCIFRNTDRHHQKNYHPSMSVFNTFKTPTKRVQKTVNVI